MASYAKVLDGKVLQVIKAESDFFDTFVDNTPGNWIQCSYNSYGGNRLDPETRQIVDNTHLRYNYPGVDWNYLASADAFYAPQPFPSWTLNTETYLWECPVEQPTEGGPYSWNEETQTWDSVSSD